MLNMERQSTILKYLKEHHSATVEELQGILYVSDATVRRDLTQMQKLGLIDRTYGGAVLLERAEEVSLYVRMNENARQKELIATKALALIPEHAETVFLDGSSTTLALVQRMNLSGKTAVTNSLQSALSLSKQKGVKLVMLGGTVSQSGSTVTGSWTTQQLKDFRFDLMLSSCFAIAENCSYENSLEQRELKRAAFERSACRILLIDRSKFTRNGVYRMLPLSDYDHVVFDELTASERESLKNVPFTV